MVHIFNFITANNNSFISFTDDLNKVENIPNGLNKKLKKEYKTVNGMKVKPNGPPVITDKDTNKELKTLTLYLVPALIPSDKISDLLYAC